MATLRIKVNPDMNVNTAEIYAKDFLSKCTAGVSAMFMKNGMLRAGAAIHYSKPHGMITITARDMD